MRFPTFRAGRADTLTARMRRARDDGFYRGSAEAKLFKLAAGGSFAGEQAENWINTAIEDGRSELEAQHALDREIEAWDLSVRIAFFVAIAPRW
jgi:hypothetical protein